MDARKRLLALLSIPPAIALVGGAARAIFATVLERQKSEIRCRLLWDRTLDMMLWLDSEQRIVETNAAARNGFGFTAAEMLGLNAFAFCAESSVGHLVEAFTLAKQHGHVTVMLNQVRKNGEEFPSEVAISSSLIGTTISTLVVVRDTSERTRADHRTMLAYENAVEASRLKSQFVATMSHEIRTPMNAVLGMNELLLGTDLSAEQLEYTQTVKDSSHALLSIIDDILDFSKIEAGGLELEIMEMNMPDTIESAVALLAPTALRKGITLMTYIDPQVPHIVLGDQVRLRQILVNLVGNAVKFTAKGGVVVSVSCRTEDRTTSQLRFTVKDSGIGFDAEAAESIFEPFRQADGTTTRRFGGTGLGLSISRRLVEEMGGMLTAESTPGFGSEFAFTANFARSTEQVYIPIESVKGLRVLIVDDDRSAQEILYRYMIDWSVSASVASSAGEALASMRESAVAQKPYDVVIIDFAMPDVTGIELAEQIKNDPRIAGTHLVMVTAYDGARRGEAAIAAGFSSYLCKPVRQAQLFDCVAQAVRAQDNAAKPLDQQRSRQPANIDAAPRSERILLVEDQPVNQKLVVQQLKKLGFAARAVGNGQQALSVLEYERFDLVLMDCQMPIMDGFEATRMIRKMELHTGRRVPIVAMTANARRQDRDACLGVGMDDYLAKPVMIDQIRAKLAMWLPSEEDVVGVGLGETAGA